VRTWRRWGKAQAVRPTGIARAVGLVWHDDTVLFRVRLKDACRRAAVDVAEKENHSITLAPARRHRVPSPRNPRRAAWRLAAGPRLPFVQCAILLYCVELHVRRAPRVVWRHP
jgi:hypothetical protein